MLKKLDNKSYIILILIAILLVSIITRPGNKINYYKKEISELKLKNQKLLYSYDSLRNENKIIDTKLKLLYLIIEEKEKTISSYNDKIEYYKRKQNEIPSKIKFLNADGVATEFTNYIKTKRSKSVHK
jgi:chromosome segregation ATPase